MSGVRVSCGCHVAVDGLPVVECATGKRQTIVRILLPCGKHLHSRGLAIPADDKDGAALSAAQVARKEAP